MSQGRASRSLCRYCNRWRVKAKGRRCARGQLKAGKAWSCEVDAWGECMVPAFTLRVVCFFQVLNYRFVAGLHGRR